MRMMLFLGVIISVHFFFVASTMLLELLKRYIDSAELYLNWTRILSSSYFITRIDFVIKIIYQSRARIPRIPRRLYTLSYYTCNSRKRRQNVSETQTNVRVYIPIILLRRKISPSYHFVIIILFYNIQTSRNIILYAYYDDIGIYARSMYMYIPIRIGT